MSSERLARLRARLAELGLEAMLITQADNRRYISGFTGSTGTLLVSAEHALFITDFRYYDQVAQQAPQFTLVKQTKSFAEALSRAVRTAGVRRIAVESRDVSLGLFEDMREALVGRGKKPIAELQPAAGIVEPLRAVKDESEIALMARAAAITDAAFAAARAVWRVGMTEIEAAWEIERRMRELGAQGVGFELIVQAGPNSALPHARPSTATLQEGQPIVVDIGACVDGYRSDMTRTICLGKPTARFRKIYSIVLEAQLAALDAAKAGAIDREVDAVARTIIAAAGYGKRFGHGLGHGVGLQVHEQPRLSPMVKEPRPLVPGHVVTIEPGIYLPGWGGVRIEDLVVITETGARKLTASPK